MLNIVYLAVKVQNVVSQNHAKFTKKRFLKHCKIGTLQKCIVFYVSGVTMSLKIGQSIFKNKNKCYF